MTTDSHFSAYARIIKDSKQPSWMLCGGDEWRIEKAIRFGYMLAIEDMREFSAGRTDFSTTTIEKEHEELAKKRPI